MSGKIKRLLQSCFAFWKGFLLSENKRDFLKLNQGTFKNQIIFLLSSILCCFVFLKSMKPAVRGVCRIVLSDSNMMEGMGSRLVGVEAMKAKKGTTLKEVKSIGTLKANQEVVIKAEIPGKIAQILFTEGVKVNEGDELIKFEDDLYKAEKEKYEAEYTLRKAEFDRVKKLYEGKAGSQKNYDEALGQLNAAKAQLDSSAFQLSKTVIKAPFTGTIGIMKGSVTPGNIVQQHTELVDIVDNSQVKVEFSVPAKYIDDIAVGQTVEIDVDAFVGRAFSGVVDAIDSEVDTKNHSVLVRAVIPNKSGLLRHGMFANVKLIIGEKTDVILIDEDALDREGAIEFVWLIDDKGRAYRRRVLTGSKDASGIEIVAGLKDGDIVVISGQLKLTDGSKTKILNKEDFEEGEKETVAEKNEKLGINDDEEAQKNAPESLLDQKVGDEVQEKEKSVTQEEEGSKSAEEKSKEDNKTEGAE